MISSGHLGFLSTSYLPRAGRMGIGREEGIEMTKQRVFKRLVRERMQKTGESYSAARLHLASAGTGGASTGNGETAMFCAYCGKDRPDDIVTKEHVVPKALGGALTPTNPFLLDVCEPCNDACGRWVDGPFIRSFLVHNARAQLAYEYVDPSAHPYGRQRRRGHVLMPVGAAPSATAAAAAARAN